MFWYNQNALRDPHASAFGEKMMAGEKKGYLLLIGTETINNCVMEGKREVKKGRGGRPKKAVKRDQLLGVKCTLLERTTIEQKAALYALTLSDFMRLTAVNYPGNLPLKQVVPKEVLELKGLFNHTAANVNQLAHRHNCGDAITHADRARLMILEEKIGYAVLLISKHYS